MEHDLYLNPNDFCHKRKMDNFDPYNVLLAIATNIPVLLMTAFVLQGHIFMSFNALIKITKLTNVKRYIQNT